MGFERRFALLMSGRAKENEMKPTTTNSDGRRPKAAGSLHRRDFVQGVLAACTLGALAAPTGAQPRRRRRRRVARRHARWHVVAGQRVLVVPADTAVGDTVVIDDADHTVTAKTDDTITVEAADGTSQTVAVRYE